MKASARLGCVSPALLFYSAAAAAAAPILNPRRSKNKLQQRVSSNNVSVSECTITVVRPRQQCTICYASRHCQKDDSLSSLVQLCFSRQLLEVCGPLQWSVSDLLFLVLCFWIPLKASANVQIQTFFWDFILRQNWSVVNCLRIQKKWTSECKKSGLPHTQYAIRNT